MATLKQLVNEAISLMESAKVPKDTRFEGDYLEAKIVEYASRVIVSSYVGSRERGMNQRIDPTWITKPFKLTYDRNIQDAQAKYIKFACPMPMRLTERVNGMQFFGNLPKMQNWTQYRTLAAAMGGLRMKDINASHPAYVLTPTYLYLFGDSAVREPDTVMIPADPRTLPTTSWNKYVDDYPIDEYSKTELFPLMFRNEFNIELMRPVGINNDNPNN